MPTVSSLHLPSLTDLRCPMCPPGCRLSPFQVLLSPALSHSPAESAASARRRLSLLNPPWAPCRCAICIITRIDFFTCLHTLNRVYAHMYLCSPGTENSPGKAEDAPLTVAR